MLPVRRAQMLTYPKLSELRLGLLIKFNIGRIKDSFQRLAPGT
ncbi:MAG TPA: GxxExxY protein [Alphaproteobacteria bacterium]|nr:GxxExxY protein [Alphaproteobacteria bacterium]